MRGGWGVDRAGHIRSSIRSSCHTGQPRKRRVYNYGIPIHPSRPTIDKVIISSVIISTIKSIRCDTIWKGNGQTNGE